jgi:hypothetical protein
MLAVAFRLIAEWSGGQEVPAVENSELQESG